MLIGKEMILKPLSPASLPDRTIWEGHGMDGRGENAAAAMFDIAPAAAFRSRIGPATDDRLAETLVTLVDTLGNLITSLNLSRQELRAAIAFLTEVGEACSDQRQEWVLLADTLGLTTTVERLAVRRPDGATPNTLPGPFYRPDAPAYDEGDSISIDGKGEPLLIGLQVTDLDGLPVPQAFVEIWQANGDGLYENQEPDLQPEFNLRGQFRTGPDGRVTIRSVRPAGYAIPANGPVGRLLGQLGIRLDRPAHLHFRITAPGFQRLTTHVFDRADPAITRDPLFAVHAALLTDFIPGPDSLWSTTFRFVLARARPGEEVV
jgi:hydroxyquinol 1,2-dioxygenase